MQTRDSATIKTTSNYSETQVWANYVFLIFGNVQQDQFIRFESIAGFMRSMSTTPHLYGTMSHVKSMTTYAI
jgi:hypothetical protein